MASKQIEHVRNGISSIDQHYHISEKAKAGLDKAKVSSQMLTLKAAQYLTSLKSKVVGQNGK